MTDTVKVLAQIQPAANTLTAAYTVPAGKTCTMSSLTVCNTNAFVSGFFVSVAVGGAADNMAQYIYYSLPIIANDTFIATIGLTLATGDVVRVQALNTGLAFNFFGIEIV